MCLVMVTRIALIYTAIETEDTNVKTLSDSVRTLSNIDSGMLGLIQYSAVGSGIFFS